MKKTPNGLEFRSYCIPAGTIFEIFFRKVTDVGAPLKEAIDWINEKYKPFDIKVTGLSDGEQVLEKLPDEIIVKTQYTELQQLREKVKKLEMDKKSLEQALGEKFKVHFTPQDLLEFKKDQKYIELKKEIDLKSKKIAEQSKQIKSLRSDLSKTVSRLISLNGDMT